MTILRTLSLVLVSTVVFASAASAEYERNGARPNRGPVAGPVTRPVTPPVVVARPPVAPVIVRPVVRPVSPPVVIYKPDSHGDGWMRDRHHSDHHGRHHDRRWYRWW